MTDTKLVLTTVASQDEARRIANHLLGKKLAACVNIVSHVESIFLWDGKVQESQEVLLLIKTTGARYKEVEAAIVESHSYDLPECIAFDITEGSADYLKWIAESVRGK